MTDLTIRNDEQVIFALRSLYELYGYKPYKMTKFEEYDLYVRNKDFLLSDNIITFNDTNGRLMALKPDVTLSIIKNNSDLQGVKKVYYNENVYRVSKGTNSFKEIMQVGLECIGDVDTFCLCEVLSLAAESLNSISDKCVLSVSYLDIIFDILKNDNIGEDVSIKIFNLIGQKNLHELTALCQDNDISDNTVELLKTITSIHGKPDYVIEKLNNVLPNNDKVIRFAEIINSLSDNVKSIIEVDFSTAGDSKYYNGIAFKGYINGIYGSVLSGGQYDKLMQRMKRRDKAIGFAIYLDMLERYNENIEQYDVDIVLLYDNDCNVKNLKSTVSQLTYSGARVLTVKNIPQNLKFRELMKFDGKEARAYETNA